MALPAYAKPQTSALPYTPAPPRGSWGMVYFPNTLRAEPVLADGDEQGRDQIQALVAVAGLK